ncbi:Heterokaryon incompatibility protein 6, partial [Metarhizium majus ARSEF 297]
MDRYQYEPLPPDGKHIRLAVLHPRASPRPEDIRITIHHTPLEARPFMALSYVWGDASDRLDVAVAQSTTDAAARRLSVTANLAEALGHLPYADSHIVLWVDAVCINQQDLDERARHVSLVAEIYASAERVLAWTGPSAPGSNVAVNLLQRIADSVDPDPGSRAPRPRESQWTRESGAASAYFRLLLDERVALPWDGPESQALEAFFHRPWFERLWARQEIALGAADAVLLCGASSIAWAKFARAARTGCADPRDRVYGVLGILPPAARGLAGRITPDYRKPVVEVYKELVLAEMEVTRRADSCVGVPAGRLHLSGSAAVCADGQSAVSACVVDGGRGLAIKGVLAATVVDLVPMAVARSAAPQEPILPSVVALIHEVAAKLHLSDGPGYRPSRADGMLEALCYALSGGCLADHMADEMRDATTPSMAQFQRLIRFALDTTVGDASPATEPSRDAMTDVFLCVGSMVRACEETALLITEEGFVGAGPALTRPGDQISVMLGCMRPLVLRAQEASSGGGGGGGTENSSAYAVVGPCNAHGLNWGEALLGPLPEDVRLTWGPSGPVFRNRNTGEDAAADPRIDWDLLEVGAKEDAFVQRANAADGVTMYKRPDAAYFANKGARLRTFHLV